MKKLSKRFLTLAIACVMAMAMAVPAFAANTIGNPSVSAGKIYKIYPNGVTTHLLNVYGYGNENDNVTLYTPTNGNDQRWELKKVSGSSIYYYAVSRLSNEQSINIYHGTNNCQLHSYKGNTTDEKDDSALYFSTSARTIRLKDWSTLYLSFASVTTNANVYWSTSRCAWGWAAV